MQTAAKLWYLEQFDLLQPLSKREAQEMAERMTHIRYKKDDPIMFPFNSTKTIYMLKEGVVKIGNYTETGEENLKYLLKGGSVFGEMALCDGNATDFAVAVEDVLVCTIRVEELQAVMAKNKGFNTAVYKLIGFRLRKLENKIAGLIGKDSKSRIIDFLRNFAQDFGKKEGEEWVVKNLLTNREIAKLTFTSRQTVNSTLNKLKKNGNIDFDEKYIRIFDLQNV